MFHTAGDVVRAVLGGGRDGSSVSVQRAERIQGLFSEPRRDPGGTRVLMSLPLKRKLRHVEQACDSTHNQYFLTIDPSHTPILETLTPLPNTHHSRLNTIGQTRKRLFTCHVSGHPHLSTYSTSRPFKIKLPGCRYRSPNLTECLALDQ